ncbi:MAG: glycoside hydrolase family 3 C-terminal domain-containing protein, partial [Clostridia bacterium]|nr:glycoside hydrolase family 3 C-terminal domain-containing protein [Clostridia bacterium]
MKKKIFIKTSVWVALIFTFLCSMLNVGIVSSATHFYAPSEPEYGNYFNSDFETREEVLEFNRNLNEEIEGEGLVLLKNDGSLPIGGDLRVSVFGKSSVNVMSGGSGSGAGGGVPVTGFIEALQQEGFTVNPTLVNFYSDNSKSGSGRGAAPGNGNVSPGYNTGETPITNYTSDIEASYENYSDAAIVVFSRISGEGFDLPRTMMWDGSTYKSWSTASTQAVPGARDKYDHYLQLDQNESDLLKYLGDRFDNVIVLLNTGSQFEVGFLDDPGHYGYHENVKGAMWIGYPGSSGNVAIAKALKGEINPSGRTVDTWARDFKNDPVWQNFGNNLMECVSYDLKGNEYANNPAPVGSGAGRAHFSDYVIYKEGIYMGYLYYETRGYTEGDGVYSSAGKGKADVVYNQVTNEYISLSNDKDGDNEIHGTDTTDWDNWYDASVVYPFGYGLSYTTFDWEIVSANPENGAKLTADGTISIDVKVTNTGDYAGKDVVELYFTAPYYTGGIEKAHVVLGGFAKTEIIQPGDSDTVTVEMTVRDMSSYDWNDANENGFKGY